MDSLPPHAIAFRHLFATEITEYLRREGLDFEDAVGVIGELVISLARYREEGKPFFPEVFICHDLQAAIRSVRGTEAYVLGRTTMDDEGVRRALKRAAPLGGPGWSVFLQVEAGRREFAYALVRTDPFVLHPGAMESLRVLEAPAKPCLLGISQLQENVVELRASRSVFRHVYLSGARIETDLSQVVVEGMANLLGRGLDASVRSPVQHVWRRILTEALRSPHGTLMAVVSSEASARARFSDASFVTPRVDVTSHVRTYLAMHDEPSRAAVQGLFALAGRMLRADGITVVGVDGSLLAFNAFIAHRPVSFSSGGARLRTYETLAAEVDEGELVGAFYHSQDGGSRMRLTSG